MVTQKTNEAMVNEFYGLSTDTKPTEDVPNGSMFYEMDTTDIYMFDASTGTWILQSW